MNVTETAKKSKNTFQAKFLKCYRVNKEGSTKEILHVVLDLEESGVTYSVGSSFGIYPHNANEYVQKILEITGLRELEEFFRTKVNFSQITSKLLNVLYKYTQHKELALLLEDKIKFKAYTEENDLITCLRSFWNDAVPVQEFCDVLSPLLPRYYSVASSMKYVGNEVHFMVASFQYVEAGVAKRSVTSQYLRDICGENDPVTLFLQENTHFTVPANPANPIIMIGPGTGLAAFRGFIQERFATRAPGKNWLFTGDRERKHDFHYEEELRQFEEKGFLRLSTAFSRDTSTKTYVQHKMAESGAELWSWIADHGAHIYISGDAKRMAKDVQQTLLEIAIHHGHLSEDAAKSFLKDLRKDKRLVLDVY